MERKYKWFIMCLLTCFFMIPTTSSAAQNTIPNLKLDHSNNTHVLNGNWIYYDKELINPNEEDRIKEKGKIVHVPVSFSDLIGQKDGFGTFMAYLPIPKQYIGKTMAIYAPYEYNAFTLYADGVKIGSVGQVGDKGAHKSKLAPKMMYIMPKSDKILLTMQISSFDLVRGGFEKSLMFGEADDLLLTVNSKNFWYAFLSGSIFTVGLLMVSFGLYRKFNRDFLLFGLFSLSVALRSLFTVPLLYLYCFSTMSWQVGMKLEYIFTCLATFFFLTLMYSLYKNRLGKWILYILSYLLLLLIIVILLKEPETFQPIFFTLFYLCIPYAIYLIYVFIHLSRSKDKNVRVHLIGIAIVFMALLIDFFSGKGFITNVPQLSFAATTFYVVLQMFVLNNRFATGANERYLMNIRLQELNQDLDKKILNRTKELEEANQKLQKLANRDALTGVFNRHYFNEYIEKTFVASKNEGTPLAILILDIDDFKKYNDFYGHIKGDELLKSIANEMEQAVPKDGILARFGGEEFAIILPGYSQELAILIGNKVQQTIADKKHEHLGCDLKIMTVSIGIAAMHTNEDYQSVNDFINAADQKLYTGKKNGKNIVVY